MEKIPRLVLTAPLLALLACPAGVAAQDAEEVRELEHITVIAHKMPRPVRDVAGIVSVFDRREIEELVVEDIEDLVRYEPTISVDREASRFGLGGFRIRGVGGNRVAVELDGIPVPDGFAIGDFSNAGRNFVDPEIIGRVEILRGPASSLYGSEALGGVVTYTTRDPVEYLDGGKRDYGGVMRAGFNSDDDSWVATAGAAMRANDFDMLFIGSRREGGERDAKGAVENPADYEATNGLAKFVHYDDSGHATRLVVDANDFNRDTDVQSLVRAPGRFADTTLLTGDDGQRRERVSLEHELGRVGWAADGGVARLFWQRSETEQHSVEERAPQSRTPHPTRRTRTFDYEQSVVGGELTLERSVVMAGLDHVFVYGMELLQTQTEELRDASLTNLDTGETTNVVLGEVFPLRDFPNSDQQEIAVYAHDEIDLGGGWTVIPAIRAEHYELDPEPDSIYLEDFPDTPAVGVTETSISPKLAVVRHFGDHGSAFLQYSRGFRAPPFEDVNIGLEIPMFNIRAIPNPDLEAETSDGLELGYRFRDRGTAFEANLFYTEFEDLIESRVPLGFDPASGFLLFQSQNREEARIYGGELRARTDLGRFFPSLDGWSMKSALGLVRGDDTRRDEPLNGIEPDRAVLGVEYRAPDDGWRVELVGTFSESKDRVDDTAGELFRPGGYGVVDLLGHFRLSDNVRVNWGVFNLFDRRYWQWSDVQGLPADDPVVDLAARPGRHVSTTVRVTF